MVLLAGLYPGRPAAESPEAGPGGQGAALCRIGQAEEEFLATMQAEWARERIREVSLKFPHPLSNIVRGVMEIGHRRPAELCLHRDRFQ